MAFLRYQTVRNVGIGVLGAGAIAGIVALASGDAAPPAVSVATQAPSAPSQLIGPNAPASPVARPGAVLDDAAIVARADQPAKPGEKVKDAIKSSPTKVNLYEETQDSRYDRLKIDADRDDKWDHEWTRDAGGSWKREDGRVFVAGQWLDGASAPKPEVPAPTPATTPAAEPFAAQLEIVAKTMLEGRATGDKLKDLFRGNGPKVNLYDDDKDGRWDRAKVDYDRDEVDDEKLTLKGGFLERKSEKTGVVRVYDKGAWNAKP